MPAGIGYGAAARKAGSVLGWGGAIAARGAFNAGRGRYGRGAQGAVLGAAYGGWSSSNSGGSFTGGALRGGIMGAGLGIGASAGLTAGRNFFRAGGSRGAAMRMGFAKGKGEARVFKNRAMDSARFIGNTARESYNAFRSMHR